MLRAPCCARALGVTRVAAGVARYRTKPFTLAVVALIVDERPCTIERRRTEKVGAPSDDVACGIADTATDALDAGFCRRALRGVGLDCRNFADASAIAGKESLGARPLVEECAHIS